LEERNIQLLKFDPYPPTASFLGGMVKSLVKQVKRMITSSVRCKLPYEHFNFLIRECIMLVDKRPIAFKATLRDPNVDDSVGVITPELLIKGYDVPSIAVVDVLEDARADDWSPDTDSHTEYLFRRFDK
jgi:hypothetical protein